LCASLQPGCSCRSRKGLILSQMRQLVEFSLDDHHYAVDLAAVARVVHVAEVAPLPRAPEIVLGVINFAGRVIPVVNMRRRFRLPERDAKLYDHLLIARTSRRELAFMADRVAGVVAYEEDEVTTAARIAPGLEYLTGVVKLKDGLIFIHDLERFLSLDEEESLGEALQGGETV